MKKVLQFLQTSSLFAPLIACIHSLCFYKILYVPIDYFVIFHLFSATWLIYFFDAVFDNFTQELKSDRHLFVDRYQFNLCILAIALLVVNIVWFFMMNYVWKWQALGMICMALVYFILVHKTAFFRKIKELIMPPIYLVGISFVPVLGCKSLFLSSYLLFFLFAILLVQHLFAFTFVEAKRPKDPVSIDEVIPLDLLRRMGNYCTAFILLLFLFFFLDLKSLGSKMVLGIVMTSIGTSLFLIIEKKGDLDKLILELLLVFPAIVLLFD